jgi:hypothetical protein
MTRMTRRLTLVAALLLSTATAWSQGAASLSHRVWLLGGIPDDGVLARVRAAGVDAAAVPIGDLEVAQGSCRFTIQPPTDVGRLSGWSTTAVVWAHGQGKAEGSASDFLAQFAPAQRLLPGSAGLALVVRQYWDGLPAFAEAVAKQSRRRIEIVMSALELQQRLPRGGWPGVDVVAVAFGNPYTLGFVPSTLYDDLAALEKIDALGVTYRVALVVAPRAVPPPAGPVALAAIARGDVSDYTPGERGDVFVLRRAVDWGGARLNPGQRIEVDVMDTARYHRDLGLVMRPVRSGLRGWDTVGLPSPEPTLGMSLEAFLDYLQGGMPYPVPEVIVEPSGSSVRLAIDNPSPHASALSSSGNWVELHFTGTEIRDVQLGSFSGLQHGRMVDGTLTGTVARDATVVRLLVTYLPPHARIEGGVVSFLSRPRTLAARWGLRLGDGTDVSGPLRPVPVTTP